jgi:hypothetical protein
LCLSVFSTNKTDCQDITEILLKVALNTIKPNQTKPFICIEKKFGNEMYMRVEEFVWKKDLKTLAADGLNSQNRPIIIYSSL